MNHETEEPEIVPQTHTISLDGIVTSLTLAPAKFAEYMRQVGDKELPPITLVGDIEALEDDEDYCLQLGNPDDLCVLAVHVDRYGEGKPIRFEIAPGEVTATTLALDLVWDVVRAIPATPQPIVPAMSVVPPVPIAPQVIPAFVEPLATPDVETEEYTVEPQVDPVLNAESESSQPDVIIDPDFAALLDRPSDEQRALLVADLRANGGCRDSLVVSMGTPGIVDMTLLDGRTRHEICIEFGLSYEVHPKTFTSRNKAIEWVMDNQLERRNLTRYQRGKAVLKLEPIYEAEAKARQGQRNDLSNIPPESGGMLDRGREGGETLKRLAKKAGIGHDSLRMIKVIETEGSDEQKRRGNEGESIGQIYTEIRGEPKQPPPPDTVTGHEAQAEPANGPSGTTDAVTEQGGLNKPQQAVPDSKAPEPTPTKTSQAKAEQPTPIIPAPPIPFGILGQVCDLIPSDIRTAIDLLRTAVEALDSKIAFELQMAQTAKHVLLATHRVVLYAAVSTATGRALEVVEERERELLQRQTDIKTFIGEFPDTVGALLNACPDEAERVALQEIKVDFEERKTALALYAQTAQQPLLDIIERVPEIEGLTMAANT